MNAELGTAIAERRLRVSDSPNRAIWVRLGAPRPFPDDPLSNYYCPYQITGVGDERVRYAGGVDALQALELALHLLPTELDRLRQGCPGLGWLDAPDGDYGFSKAVSSFVAGDPA
jgi:hypothetical protein